MLSLKLYRIGLLFTYKYSDCGVISVTAQSMKILKF